MAFREEQAALELAKLKRENSELRKQLADALDMVAELTTENEQLKQRLQELERKSARQAAPFRRRKQKKRDPGSKKRPGRKPGHSGARRQIPDHINEAVEVPLPCCPHCCGEVDDQAPLTQFIEEIPPQRPYVTRLVTWSAKCPACGDVRSKHPLQTSLGQGAAGVQLGPRALALATMLNKQLGLTMRKTCAVLKKFYGLSITPGGLSHALGRVANKVSTDYAQLLERVRTATAVFADETSWWVGGPGWWLWVFTTDQGVTFYRVDECRGTKVVKSVLGDDFPGMLVSDCLSSYDPVDYQKHKCIAHHLQAIKKARDRPDNKDPTYLDEWTTLFQQVIKLYHERNERSPEQFAQQRTRLSDWADQLLEHSCTQSGDVAIQNRLLKQHAHLLGCLENTAAEPTNNRAERALRPAVIARKLSCCNKTEAGRRCWQILTSLAATCEETSSDFVQFLANRLPLGMQAG